MSARRTKRTGSSPQPANQHPERSQRTEVLVNEFQRCIDKSRRVRARGTRLIETSQALRMKGIVCPVCLDRSITPVKRLSAVQKKITQGNLPRAIMGYRCSKGHVFFVGKRRKRERTDIKK